MNESKGLGLTFAFFSSYFSELSVGLETFLGYSFFNKSLELDSRDSDDLDSDEEESSSSEDDDEDSKAEEDEEDGVATVTVFFFCFDSDFFDFRALLTA